jgi:diacylglycerol kinase (ATP)
VAGTFGLGARPEQGAKGLVVAHANSADAETPGSRPVVQLFLNPGSGSYSAGRIDALRRALEARGAIVLKTYCSSRQPLIDASADHLCIAGGDGTVREIVGAVATSGGAPMLSIYPMGTINLLAREARYSPDPQRFAAQLLAEAPARSFYPVAIGDGLFFVCASVGPDSAAVARVSVRLKRLIGRLAYVVAFSRVLVAWPRAQIRIEVADSLLLCEAFYVAKGRYFAGPWSFAPQAALDQPILHLVAFARMRRRDFFGFLWALLRRRPVEQLDGVSHIRCSRLTASCDMPLAVQADGDIAARLPVEIRLRETPLKFR